jgi:lipoprotein-anchoring transpeptidase ErfK/SrfK
MPRASRTRLAPLALVALASAALACGKKSDAPAAVTLSSAPAGSVENEGPAIDTAKAPKLAAIALQVSIYEKPAKGSRKIGYLRLGAVVSRSDSPSGTDGCAAGFYRVSPRGYVCADDSVSLDPQHPIARAASLRPDLTKPLPYRYTFVRAVAPQYLRVPTKEEQHKAEFKLDEHLAWFERKGRSDNQLARGANDVELPGVPPPSRPSTALSFGEAFGAQQGVAAPKTENDGFDPIPFWLQGGRKIPNVSFFKTPPYAIFADRVRRHTGLAVVGAFDGGDAADHRGFAVTTDMRLVPIDKLKPDAASTWHGVEIGGDLTLPLAFVRAKCEKNKSTCPHAYRPIGDALGKDAPLANRALVRLTGKVKRVQDTLFRETQDGTWVRASDVGVAMTPEEWPQAAKAGEKWIDVSIENQTLVLWEGKKPLYATLVSTGQDGLDDPKTTKSTPRGTFRIQSKHVTATMDSNEKASHTAEEGKTVRRGQGLFELRDVPWIAYFEAGYALHGAYWHDVFGQARSHGCVNLSPIDAKRVFGWVDPQVPESWHGVVAEPNAGTTVVIRK